MKRKLFLGLILTTVANSIFFAEMLPAQADELYEATTVVSENSDDHGIIFLGSFMGAATVIGAIVGAANGNR